jgi:hypothetical protein
MGDPPLDYAAPALKPVSDVRFRREVTLLILVDLLASMGVGLFGLIYFDRIGGASAFLIAASILTGVGIMRFLTHERPRFGAAALFLLLATATGVAAFVRCHAAYDEVRASILRNATEEVVTVYIETDRGALFATLETAQTLSAGAAAMNSLLLLYVIYRYFNLRRITGEVPRA